MSPVPILTRVVLKNYKSIASCDVRLNQLTFLVGLNGAGKSNFIDALRFCRDALRSPLDQAFATRASNLGTLSHWDPSGQSGFGMRLELSLPTPAHYSFEIVPQSPRGFKVDREMCSVGKVEDGQVLGLGGHPARFSHFELKKSGFVTEISPEHATGSGFYIGSERLYLPAAPDGGFREVHTALVDMEFYNPDPGVMKAPQNAERADILEPKGSNIASVFERIGTENPEAAGRIIDYMRRIVPGLRGINSETVKNYKVLNFDQESSSSVPHTLPANSMSDGTLRAFAVLVALFQRSRNKSRPTVIAIEEPETGLHPAAAGMLFDALQERAKFGQIIVSSHSADLLDNSEVSTESILAVDASSGATEIAPLDEAGRSSLHDRLYTAGELLRMDQLKPTHNDRAALKPELFTD
jgi:predicted ATPase